jgi:hypothetical protein
MGQFSIVTRKSILILILAIVAILAAMGLFDDLFGPTNPAVEESAKNGVNIDKALSDCFRQTIEGLRAFELTQPAQPRIRYYEQLSSEDDIHKAAWLTVNACPYEAAAWDEKCRDSGGDATACVTKSGDLARQAIKEFGK